MVWNKILENAIQTPSPHNVQPWKVRILSDLEADLLIDSSRTLPKEDLTGSFIILTMGMFIESIDILAQPLGLRLSYEITTDLDKLPDEIARSTDRRLIPFAKLRLAEGPGSSTDYPPELFHKRRTSRLSLRPSLVPENVTGILNDIARDWDQTLRITADPRQIELILKLNTDALFEDLNTTDYHDEIVEWFRYSDSQSRRHLDGLDYRCMNTSPPMFWLSATMPWLMKTPLLRNVLAKVYRSQLGVIPSLGFISGGFWKPEDAIGSGRFLMRFWLELAKHDLYIHPFGNLVTNRPIAALVEKEMDLPDIWLVFKIGYSTEPPKSYRLPLESILIS